MRRKKESKSTEKDPFISGLIYGISIGLILATILNKLW